MPPHTPPIQRSLTLRRNALKPATNGTADGEAAYGDADGDGLPDIVMGVIGGLGCEHQLAVGQFLVDRRRHRGIDGWRVCCTVIGISCINHTAVSGYCDGAREILY